MCKVIQSCVITKALDDVMGAHPDLDLTSHDSYYPDAILQANDDLMKSVLGTSIFPLLDSWRSSDRLITFEKILASTLLKMRIIRGSGMKVIRIL